jgi:hypothetical protein
MRDRNLERNIKRLEEFVELWKQLSQFLDRGFKQESFTPDEELAFLDLKSQIARQHEMLMAALGGVADRDDKALRLLNTVPSLQAFKELPEGMARKIASEWHGTFIAMQALLGRLGGRQEQLASVSTVAPSIRRVFGHPLVIMLLLTLAGFGAYRVGLDALPKIEHWILGDNAK